MKGAEAAARPPAPDEPYEVPGGTSELAWNIAAAWAETSVEDLLADRPQVTSTHYMAALRVTRVFSDWLLREDAAAEAHAVAADASWWAGDKAGLEVPKGAGVDDDAVYRESPFYRVMVMAEDVAVLTAGARDRGDAVRAAQFSNIETSLLQVAAGLQIAIDLEKKVP